MAAASITEAGIRSMINAAFPGMAITSEIIAKIAEAAGWTLARARSEYAKLVEQIQKTSAILRETRAKLASLKAARPGDAGIARLMTEQDRLEQNQTLLTRRTVNVGDKLGSGITTPTEIADLGIAPIIIAGAALGIIIVIVILSTWVAAQYREASAHKKSVDFIIAQERAGEITPAEAAAALTPSKGAWYEQLVAWAPYIVVGWFGLQFLGIYAPGAPARRR